MGVSTKTGAGKRASTHTRVCVRTVLAAVAAVALGGCHRAPPPDAPPAMVVALPLQSAPAGDSDRMRYPVEVGARYANSLSFRIGGKIVERVVRLGDRVRRGQVLARLDPMDTQKQLVGAQASFDGAEQRLSYAQQQLTRDQAQSERNLIAASQLEQTRDAFNAARAARDQAAAQLAIARNSLAYTSLASDHHGVITSENADSGQVVSAGQPIYGLAWDGDSDVLLDAAEADIGRIWVGQTAEVRFPGLPGRQYSARVREIAPAADPQSRTYRVKLTVSPPDAALRLGMTGDAVLGASALAGATTQDKLFSVPVTALFHRDREPAVWIVDSNSALQLRGIRVARYAGDSILVSSGLQDGDVVVVAGVHTVYAGEHVRAVRPLYDDHAEIVPSAASAQ